MHSLKEVNQLGYNPAGYYPIAARHHALLHEGHMSPWESGILFVGSILALMAIFHTVSTVNAGRLGVNNLGVGQASAVSATAPRPSTFVAAATAIPIGAESSQSKTDAKLEVDNQKLQTVLDSWAASHPDHVWSVAIQGLGPDKRVAAVNADKKQTSASIFKLLLLYPLFQKYSIDYLASNYVSVAGKSPISLKQCVELMIVKSDNDCGVVIGGSATGWSNASKAVKQIGLSGTNLNDPNGATTTATDTTLYLQKLYANELFNSDTTNYVLGLMKQQVYRGGIPAGCGDCIVADKTGDLGNVRNDAGIVEFGGQAYALSIFTVGASYSQIAELTSQIQSIMAQ